MTGMQNMSENQKRPEPKIGPGLFAAREQKYS